MTRTLNLYRLLIVGIAYLFYFSAVALAFPHGEESETGGLYWRAEGKQIDILFPEREATFKGTPFIRVGILWHSDRPLKWYAQFPTDERDGKWRPIPQIWSEHPIYIAHIDTPNQQFLSRVKLKFEGPVKPTFIYIELIPKLGPADSKDTDHSDSSPFPGKTVEEKSHRGEIGTTQTALTAPYLPRSAWGAKPPKCRTADPVKKRIAIHHTAGSNTTTLPPERILRSIQSFHQNTRKWCDIAYHILISKDGRAWEGRPYNVLGSHVGGHNRGTLGISFMGTFKTVTPNQKMLCAGSKVIAWAVKKFGIPRNRTYIKGHREYPGQSTSCPGNKLLGKIDWMIQQSASGGCGGTPPTPTPSKCDYVKTTRLGGSPLNIRQQPTARSADIGDIPEGTCLKVLAKTDSGQSIRGNSTWYKVNYRGVTGWISGYYADCSNCGGTTPSDGKIEGTVKSAATSAPIGGAVVSVKGGPSKTTGSDGRFSFTLKPGTYTVEVKASGYKSAQKSVAVKAGQTATVSFALTPDIPPPTDTVPPAVKITYPPDQFATYSQTVEVRGTASDNVGVVSLRVNGQSVGLDGNGNFRTQVQLQLGRNTIEVVALDGAGNRGSDKVTVFYRQRELAEERGSVADAGSGGEETGPTPDAGVSEAPASSDGGVATERPQNNDGETLSIDTKPQVLTISSADQAYPCKTTQECYPPLVCIKGKCVKYEEKKASGCSCDTAGATPWSMLLLMLVLLGGIALRRRIA